MAAKERLIYLPLGGAGEIGMNCYVYGYGKPGQERLIVVDLGVTFPDMDTTPGVDLIFPDVSWLEERKNRIDGIFITHAHEDHVGAIGQLWDKLDAPVYTRAFTAIHARRKMEEAGHNPDKVQTMKPWPDTIALGPFQVGFLPISHSIPESSALVIDTPEGRVVHTGDFKIDYQPGVGEAFDRDLWASVAKVGVKALVCDSTNVFNHHEGRSESTVGPEIARFVAEQRGMVVATTFASNVARVRTLANAGVAAGRSVCLLGRAMQRMIEASTEAGVLPDFPSVVSPEDAGQLPRENLMLIVTGSQGERRAASAQLARGKYMGLSMKEGDTFLFSSKTIPGNERGVIEIMNAFSEKGVDIQDDDGGRYHVSGHANRPDLVAMHELVKPQIVIPMHGEHRHLREHVKLAESGGRLGVLAPNGTCVSLSGNKPEIVEYVETGRVYLDGTVQVGALDGVVRDRIRMALNGHAVVSLVLDEDDSPLGEPWVDLKGLPELGSSGASLSDVMEADLDQALQRADDKIILDDDRLDELIRRVARQSANAEIGRKPEVTVVISRLS
ncbi:ribonuclease J [Palleronia marisminoris]|uniref:Ribonuclease J 1 n=1 Tax=Palleronia marisminoris TaxID=315423 RepID=A0A1Y5TAP1_9RHOB|nr:ribonuclease J [Palleronia marisminoris]SFH34754.1 ribonuclease J [Palleronia marisminoris]SLN59764.1 Ribonuclease J 1 [Palleronia marisminoris]